MKKTDPGSSPVRKAAMSALRSSAGPAVCTNGTPSSAATMFASEVLPRPGGPASSTWSRGSPRLLGRLDEDLELRGDLLLVDEVGQSLRPQRGIELVFAAGQARIGEPLVGRRVEPIRGLGRRVGDTGIARDAHDRVPVPSGAAQRRVDELLGTPPSVPSSRLSASVSV